MLKSIGVYLLTGQLSDERGVHPMQVQSLLNDEEAVSPVIGVILMVAITVILAAVIATFVLGLGEQVSQTAPQASFTFDYTEGGTTATPDFDGTAGDGNLTITHAGGATLTASNLYIRGSTPGDNGAWGGTNSPYAANSEISAGDSVKIDVNSDDTIRVVWQSSQGSQSAVLREWVGPDA